MKTVRISDNPIHPQLAGKIATIIKRRGKWLWVRVDDHEHPLDTDGKGWFLPKSKVQPCR